MIEINERVEINVTRIANGFLVNLEKSQGYGVTRSPQTYYSSLDAIRAELSPMLDAALALEVADNAEPDF